MNQNLIQHRCFIKKKTWSFLKKYFKRLMDYKQAM